MKTIYYYFYLFYSSALKEFEPHFNARFSISLSQALMVNGILNIIAANLFCKSLNKWEMIGIFVLIFIINSYLIYNSESTKKIIKEKPRFFNNQKLSIILTITFFVLTMSYLFWGSIYIRNILEQCK